MGLDQYLYKANKKFKTDEKLERYKLLVNVGDKDLRNYELSKKDKDDFIKREASDTVYAKYSSGDVDVVSRINAHIEDFINLIEEYTNRTLLGEDFKEDVKEDEIYYWRKHSDLQGYMTELWVDRGNGEEFNCKNLILNKEQCEDVINFAKSRLRAVQKGEEGNHYTGFFWGESCEEDWIDTINIFEDVIATTNFDEETIYYSSWW